MMTVQGEKTLKRLMGKCEGFVMGFCVVISVEGINLDWTQIGSR